MIRLLILPVLTILMAFPLSEESTFFVPHKEAAYPEHLTGTFTGGFGEETCRSCHFDYDLNPDDGLLTLSGIPGRISEGETIEILVRIEREKLGRAGFQLSARYADGKQAGAFEIGGDERMMFTKAVPDSLDYIQHSNSGSNPLKENKTSWVITWKAPEPLAGPVIFNVAANAANGDQSEFGDFIYTEEIKADAD